jgi:soluble lytic murein transglycosylase-like protein
MSIRRACAPIVLLIAWAALPAAAEAQIYYWRDASGNLVLSDRAKDPAAVTYAANAAGTIRTTRAALPRRASAYDPLIEEHSGAYGVSSDLVRAVIHAESAFNPRARSPKGAMGLMQLMPATAAQYGVANPYDPAENIRGGIAHLRDLLTRYGNDVELALAAYNAGVGAVARYGSVPPYRETRDYVRKIRATVDTPRGPVTQIYRTIEIVNGREVPRYSSVKTPGAEPIDSARR